MNVLEAKAISLSTPRQAICDEVSFTLHTGEIVGILGPNGCGKTTLLQVLAGLIMPSKGEVCLNQQPLKNISTKIIAQKLGFLFQHFQLPFSQSVEEYCLASRFPHRSYFQRNDTHDKNRVKQALQLMELTAYQNRLMATLSGGEKKRAAIAALLVQDPAIFLLDEPLNHLDVRHQVKVLKHFQLLAEAASKTIVVTLHDMNIAQQFCQRILLMYPNGEILQGKTHDIITIKNLSRLYEHPITRTWHFTPSYQR